MNNVYCDICGQHYNASRMNHTCAPDELLKIFADEQYHGDTLDSTALRGLRREIITNGSPTLLVKAWEQSAGRPFDS